MHALVPVALNIIKLGADWYEEIENVAYVLCWFFHFCWWRDGAGQV